jgi:Recombinase
MHIVGLDTWDEHSHHHLRGQVHGRCPRLYSDPNRRLRSYGRACDGRSVEAIAMELNRRGFRTTPTRKDAATRAFEPGTVQNVLNNPRYAGVVVHQGERLPDVKAQWPAFVRCRDVRPTESRTRSAQPFDKAQSRPSRRAVCSSGLGAVRAVRRCDARHRKFEWFDAFVLAANRESITARPLLANAAAESINLLAWPHGILLEADGEILPFEVRPGKADAELGRLNSGVRSIGATPQNPPALTAETPAQTIQNH